MEKWSTEQSGFAQGHPSGHPKLQVIFGELENKKQYGINSLIETITAGI